jgi:hypothetical protein
LLPPPGGTNCRPGHRFWLTRFDKRRLHAHPGCQGRLKLPRLQPRSAHAPTTHIPPATPVTPIAHTACALLALRTFGLYTDSPFPQHDYLLDPVSLGLAGLVVALLTLRWWLQGPQAIALSSAPASAPTSAAPASGSSATSADTAAPAPSLDAPLAQLKTAMFAGFWYLGYLFPRRKIAAILQENHPGQASTFDTHFSLYLGIVRSATFCWPTDWPC